jgi:hypothetical protein
MTEDSDLLYDVKFHKYYLNPLGEVSNRIDVNIYGDGPDVEKALKGISRSIYNYVYKHTHTANKNWAEYTLAMDTNVRLPLMEAMLAQAEADEHSGIESNKNMNNINSKGTITHNSLEVDLVCEEAREILDALVDSNGKRLCYMGDYGIRLNEERYDTYEY